MKLASTLRSDLRSALGARDRDRARVIRGLLAEMENTAAVPTDDRRSVGTKGLYSGEAPRRAVSDEDMRRIVSRELDELDRALELVGDGPRSRRMREDRVIVAGYLTLS